MFSRHAPAAGLGLIALLAAGVPASAQQRVPPVPRVTAIDSGVVPRRDPIIPPPAPVAAVPAAQRTPVEVEPLRPLLRTPPPVQAARVATPDSVAALAAPLVPQRPTVSQAVVSPAAELRSVGASNVQPVGATGRCKDGSYLTGTASDAACTNRGGLAVAFPPPRVAPAARP